ncbi:MAG: hypothetical protein U0Y10_03300 [Spirosomataceae bacterium]
MKSLFLFLLVSNIILAQDLKKVAITDSVEKKVLFDYIRSCHEVLHPFKLGYGVVSVVVFQDSLGLKNWSLSGYYDDRYEENLPLSYAYYQDHVIMFYYTDKNGRVITRKPTQEELERWRALVKGWILYRPGVMDKWPQHNNMRRYEHTYKGEVQVRFPLEPIGLHWNSIYVKFFKDGTYKITKPL